MSAHGFRSLFMAASVAGAALGCYLVSLTVATERSKLESVEAKILSTQRDIRMLQTEIGTRGRLAQLERWNANYVRLSAPSADQFLEGSFQLATLVKPPAKPAVEAPVVLASAPVESAVGQRPAATSDDADAKPAAALPPKVGRPDEMMHVAGYSVPAKPAKPAAAVPPRPAKPRAAADPLAPKPGAKAQPKDDSAGQ